MVSYGGGKKGRRVTRETLSLLLLTACGEERLYDETDP